MTKCNVESWMGSWNMPVTLHTLFSFPFAVHLSFFIDCGKYARNVHFYVRNTGN